MHMWLKKEGRRVKPRERERTRARCPLKEVLARSPSVFSARRRDLSRRTTLISKPDFRRKVTQFLLLHFFCNESNLINVGSNTWWIDSSSIIHISNTLQGFLN